MGNAVSLQTYGNDSKYLSNIFQVIYDVTRVKSNSLNRFGRILGNVSQQVMLNKLAIRETSGSLSMNLAHLNDAYNFCLS